MYIIVDALIFFFEKRFSGNTNRKLFFRGKFKGKNSKMFGTNRFEHMKGIE